MSARESIEEQNTVRDEFSFLPIEAQRSFPRPWERIPQKSVAPQLRGRQIWKRYNLRGSLGATSNDEGTTSLLDTSKKAMHSIKRRRLRDPLEGLDSQSPAKPMRYITTSYETQDGTPQRKVKAKSPRKSPTKSPIKSPMKATVIQQSPTRRQSLRVLGMKERRQTKSPIKKSPIRVSRTMELSPSVRKQSQDAITPSSADRVYVVIESDEEDDLQPTTTKALGSDDLQFSYSFRPWSKLSNWQESVALDPEDELVFRSGHTLVQTSDRSPEDLSPQLETTVEQCEEEVYLSLADYEPVQANLVDDPGDVKPRPLSTLPRVLEIEKEVKVDDYTLVSSEAVERSYHVKCPTSIRERLNAVRIRVAQYSLSRASFSNAIVQKTSVATLQSSTKDSSSPEELSSLASPKPSDVMPCDASDDKSTSYTTIDSQAARNFDELSGQTQIKNRKDFDTSNADGDNNVEAEDSAMNEKSRETDKARALEMEASAPRLHFAVQSQNAVGEFERAVLEPNPAATLNSSSMNKTGKLDDGAEEDAERAFHDDHPAPLIRTRSRARISDETTMLKDFLSRAHARRAASKPAGATVSPPKSPSYRPSRRKALQPLDANSPSPTKSDEPIDEPDISTLAHPDLFPGDDLGQPTPEPTSQRRSARTRLVVTGKGPVGAPSLIPLRRPDGADPVILHKSANQELSTVTRANTRRNKGRARLPKYMLSELAERCGHEIADQEGDSIVDGQRLGIKTVHWDEERLVRYQEVTMEASEGIEAKRVPKMRRLKGLGATNGTPAPKRATLDLLAPVSSSKVRKPKAVAKAST